MIDDADLRHFTYVFVRTDMPIANQIVQVGHAAQEAGNKFPYPEEDSSYLILFGVANEDELLGVIKRAEMNGVDIHAFYEPDFPQGYTAACTAPLQGAQRRPFSKYKLWR